MNKIINKIIQALGFSAKSNVKLADFYIGKSHYILLLLEDGTVAMNNPIINKILLYNLPHFWFRTMDEMEAYLELFEDENTKEYFVIIG